MQYFLKSLKVYFVLIALVIICVVVGANYISSRTVASMQELFYSHVDYGVERTTLLVELRERIRYLVREVDIFLDAPMQTKEDLDALITLTNQIEERYRAYRALGATTETFSAILVEKEAFITALLSVQEKLVRREDITEVDRENIRVTIEGFSNQIEAAQEAEVSTEVDVVSTLTDRVARNNKNRLLANGSIIIVLIGLAFFLYRGVLKPLLGLRRTALSIAYGDESRTTRSRFLIEINDVSRAINVMLNRMRGVRLELEEKVVELDNSLKELARVEKKTNEERALYERLLVSIGDAVLVIDKDTFKVRLANEHALELLHTEDDILGKKVTKVLSLSHRESQKTFEEEKFWKVILTDKEPQVIERELALTDARGVTVPISLVAAPVFDEVGEPLSVIVTFRDVSELVRLEEARVSFISAASHQLRTPLSSMRWFVEMMLDGDFGKLTKKQKDAVGTFGNSTMRMISLINALLLFSRVESKRVRVNPKLESIPKFVKEVISTLTEEAQARNITFTIDTKGEIPQVAIDHDLVWQAILNYATNAIRYATEGSVVHVTIESDKKMIRVSVSNEGEGIPVDVQDHIFKKFYRAPNAQKMVPNGNGLGLAFVKLLVEEWGGTVGFESETGKTTTFWFTLPKKGMKQRKGEVSLQL